MKIQPIRIEDIEIGARHRALSEDAVTRLAASIEELGLLQPITVRVVEEMELDGVLTAGVPFLVAGRHRLAAAKRLGWTHIDCVEVDDDAIAAELVELAENLHRLDLTKEQRDEHIRRYAELLEDRAAKVVQSEPLSVPVTGRGNKGIARQIADETGLSKSTVQRALNPKPAAEVIPISVRTQEDAILAQANAIVAAWNRAGPEARAIAWEQIDGPVFEQTRAGAR